MLDVCCPLNCRLDVVMTLDADQPFEAISLDVDPASAHPVILGPFPVVSNPVGDGRVKPGHDALRGNPVHFGDLVGRSPGKP